jgi:hypothetical protein
LKIIDRRGRADRLGILAANVDHERRELRYRGTRKRDRHGGTKHRRGDDPW